MNNNQYTYNQQIPQKPMPPMNGVQGTVYGVQGPINGVRGTVYGAQRQRRPNAAAKAIFPKWLSRNALITYFLALAVVSFMYSAYPLPWYYMLSGVVAVGVFFLYGSTAIKDTSLDKIRKESRFEKRIFLIAFVPRVIWMLLIYTIFMQNYGDAFGFENGDATYYDTLGQFVAGLIKNGNFHFYDSISVNGTMSTFAKSERFHQPVMPFEFMFAAYGLSIAVTKLKYKRWFTYWCVLMLVACIAWNWFKLAGRGLS